MRILVASQDRGTRDRVASAMHLESQVLFADYAASGHEALARLAARRADVLLVGLPLPDMSGVEFVRTAKRAVASCQILLLAAAGAEEVMLAAIEAGAAGCVLEPCDARELVAHALKLRAGGSPLNPLVARRLVERLHARTLAHAAVAALTARESDVVSLLANGLSYSQIGDKLGVSLNTVGSHIKNAYRKLDVHSATAAVMRAVELQTPGKA